MSGSRTTALVFPREHGAWGILLVPLFTGGLAAIHRHSDILAFVSLTVLVLALFSLRTPAEVALGWSIFRAQTPEERKAVRNAIAAYAVVGAVCAVVLLLRVPPMPLLALGVVAAALFAAQAQVRKMGRAGRMPAQLIGTLGLTSTAAAAHYVVTEQVLIPALVIWVANWAFAADQIHFVQVRIASARATSRDDKLQKGITFLFGQAMLTGVVTAAMIFGLVPWLAGLGFLPILLRGFWWFVEGPKPLDVHRLGVTELVYAILFGVLFTVGMRLE